MNGNTILLRVTKPTFGADIEAAIKVASDIEITGILASDRNSGRIGSLKDATIKASAPASSAARRDRTNAGATTEWYMMGEPIASAAARLATKRALRPFAMTSVPGLAIRRAWASSARS